jgi:hypothetical protein
VGIRTEISKKSSRKINAINSKSSGEISGWDEHQQHRKRFSPPVHDEPFPKLDENKSTEVKLHKLFIKKLSKKNRQTARQF